MRWLALALLAVSALQAAPSKRALLEWAEAQPWRNDAAADPSKIPVEPGVEFSRPDGLPSGIELDIRENVSCGEDTWVFLYQWTGEKGSVGKWMRRFEFEPDNPLDSVRVQANASLVLVTGWPPACASAWRPFFIGLYRLTPAQKTVLSGTEIANSESDTTARLEPNAIQVEFTGQSIDPLLAARRRVLHYAIGTDGSVRRVDPIALSAEDFVDEWIASPWRDASAWSTPGLGPLHDQLPKKGQMGTVTRCSGADGLWQVSVALGGDWKYFRVLDSGQHRYRLIDAGSAPCKPKKR